MALRVVDREEVLDAHVELEGSDLRLHSRSGRRGAPDARNSDYGPGLRAILEQLATAGVRVTDAWVDSSGVQNLPLDDRRILQPGDSARPPAEQFSLMSQRMRQVGRSDNRPGGNNNKLIRIRTDASPGTLGSVLNLATSDRDMRSANRLPDAELRRVGARHIWLAIEALRVGQDIAPDGPATEYDVILDDGIRLPPKAIFGRAATLALGFEVGPQHFSAGRGTVCFHALEAAGFPVVARGTIAPSESFAETEGWAEGVTSLVHHLKRERARGLANAKKDAFRASHGGRLFCEDCGLEPAKTYADPLADACIEVHHARIALADMSEGHVSRLEDVRCVCANCHRLEHARLRVEVGRTSP